MSISDTELSIALEPDELAAINAAMKGVEPLHTMTCDRLEIVPVSPALAAAIRTIAGTPNSVSGQKLPIVPRQNLPGHEKTWVPIHQKKGPCPRGKAAICRTRQR